MAENNEVAVEQQQPKAKKHFGAACKEFLRKSVVSLKRKPQNIAFLVLLVTTIFYIVTLATPSEPIVAYNAPDWSGLMVFVITLLSLLVVVTFMRSFPKMKKPAKQVKHKDGTTTFKENKSVITLKEGATKLNISIPMLCLTFAMLIIMILCEVYYRKLVGDYCWTNFATKTTLSETDAKYYDLFTKSQRNGVVHMVLLAVSIFITALIPLYTKLLVRINTSKKLEDAVGNMQEIDLAADE